MKLGTLIDQANTLTYRTRQLAAAIDEIDEDNETAVGILKSDLSRTREEINTLRNMEVTVNG